MIRELNDGERQGNIVWGAGEEGVYTGSDVDRLAGRMVGSGLWESTHKQGILCCVLTVAAGECGRPVKRSWRGSCGNWQH